MDIWEAQLLECWAALPLGCCQRSPAGFCFGPREAPEQRGGSAEAPLPALSVFPWRPLGPPAALPLRFSTPTPPLGQLNPIKQQQQKAQTQKRGKKQTQTVSKIRHNPTRDDPSSNPPLRRAPGFHTSTHFVRDAEDENRMPTTLWDVWAVPPAHPWMPETPPAVSEAVLSVRLKAQCWVSAA